MRITTRVCARFSSVGYPKMTRELDSQELNEVILALAKWLTEVKMGARVEITIARRMSELRSGSQASAGGMDRLSEVEALLKERLPAFLAESDSDEPVYQGPCVDIDDESEDESNG